MHSGSSAVNLPNKRLMILDRVFENWVESNTKSLCIFMMSKLWCSFIRTDAIDQKCWMIPYGNDDHDDGTCINDDVSDNDNNNGGNDDDSNHDGDNDDSNDDYDIVKWRINQCT